VDEKKVQKYKQRLTEEYQKLIRSINRNRLAEEEITLENTEDEGDLATISHNKELLYNLHESDFQRLKSIQEALKRMDRGEYGECLRCSEDINEKRLLAVDRGGRWQDRDARPGSAGRLEEPSIEFGHGGEELSGADERHGTGHGRSIEQGRNPGRRPCWTP